MIGFIEIVAWITLVAVCIQGPLGAILEGQYTKGLGENLAIQGSLLNSFDSISSNARCAGRCTNERNCLSYNYNKEQRKCQLNSVSSKHGSPTAAPGYKYFDRTPDGRYLFIFHYSNDWIIKHIQGLTQGSVSYLL